MSTRLSNKKVEDVACAILNDDRLKAFHDILRVHLAPIISQKSTNPLLTNGSNVTYNIVQKKALMDKVEKPKPTQMKPDNRLFNEKVGIDLVNAYKKTNNLKKVTADDKTQIVSDFRSNPANEAIYQAFVKEYDVAIDEFYQAIMEVKNDNGNYAFRGNSLYTFNRVSCEMSQEKKAIKTAPIPLRRSERIQTAAGMESDDE